MPWRSLLSVQQSTSVFYRKTKYLSANSKSVLQLLLSWRSSQTVSWCWSLTGCSVFLIFIGNNLASFLRSSHALLRVLAPWTCTVSGRNKLPVRQEAWLLHLLVFTHILLSGMQELGFTTPWKPSPSWSIEMQSYLSPLVTAGLLDKDWDNQEKLYVKSSGSEGQRCTCR